MRLVMFNDFVPGVLDGNRVVDISPAVSEIPHMSPQELMSGIIADFDSLRGNIDDLVSSSDGVDRTEVRLRPPLPKPTQIVAMAANYMEHGARSAPALINAFLKSSNSIIGDGDTLVLPDAPANIFHHEAELGLVIGSEAAHVNAEDAYQYIFGYVNFIDGSARGLGGSSFFQGKSWDTFGPVGPCIVTADEIDDPMDLNIRLWVNGNLRQDFLDQRHGLRHSPLHRVGERYHYTGTRRHSRHWNEPPGPGRDAGRRRDRAPHRRSRQADDQRSGRPQARVVARYRPGDRRLCRRADDIRRLWQPFPAAEAAFIRHSRESGNQAGQGSGQVSRLHDNTYQGSRYERLVNGEARNP